jgi:hypothetical protein
LRTATPVRSIVPNETPSLPRKLDRPDTVALAPTLRSSIGPWYVTPARVPPLNRMPPPGSSTLPPLMVPVLASVSVPSGVPVPTVRMLEELSSRPASVTPVAPVIVPSPDAASEPSSTSEAVPERAMVPEVLSQVPSEPPWSKPMVAGSLSTRMVP